MCVLSCVWLFAAILTAAHQAPPSLEFSRQEYWSELPYPSSRDFPNSGIKPRPPALQADSLPLELPGKPEPPGSGKQIRKVYTISDGMGVMKKGKAGEHERVNSTVNFYGYLCKTWKQDDIWKLTSSKGRREMKIYVCVCVCLAEGMPRTQINKIRNKRCYNWYQRNTKDYKRPLWTIICEQIGQSRKKKINF